MKSHPSQYPGRRQWSTLTLAALLIGAVPSTVEATEWRAAVRIGGGIATPRGGWYDGLESAGMGEASVAVAVPRRRLAVRLELDRGGARPDAQFQLLAGRERFRLALWRAVLGLDLFGDAPGPTGSTWTVRIGGGRAFHAVDPPVGGDVLPRTQRSPLGGSDTPALWLLRLGLDYALALGRNLGAELGVGVDQLAPEPRDPEGGSAALLQVTLRLVWWLH